METVRGINFGRCYPWQHGPAGAAGQGEELVMFKNKFFLLIFTIYQLFSTAFICVGIWPDWVIFINLALQLAAVFFFDLEYALYSVILSIPFYLAVPNSQFDSLSAWRL